MSSNASTNQFVPSALKKVSIIFFCFVIVGIITVIFLSPQLIRDRTDLRFSQEISSTPIDSKPSIASATSSADLLTTNSVSNSSSIESVPATNNESAQPTPTSTSQVQSETSTMTDAQHCQFSGTQEAKIIGIIFKNNRYFYTPGSQPYYALQKLDMVEKWFCHKAIAIEQGWIEGPADILELRNKSNARNKDSAPDQSDGIVKSLLNVLGM